MTDDHNIDVLRVILDEIKVLSNRGAALVAAALVEQYLALAIQGYFVDLSEADKAHLFDGYGPLSTFSARIRLGYAMGIFGPKVRSDLEIIHYVRNEFTRAHMPLSFDSDDIAVECAQLSLPAQLKVGSPTDETPRGRYITTTEALVSAFVGAYLTKRDARPKPLHTLLR